MSDETPNRAEAVADVENRLTQAVMDDFELMNGYSIDFVTDYIVVARGIDSNNQPSIWVTGSNGITAMNHFALAAFAEGHARKDFIG